MVSTLFFCFSIVLLISAMGVVLVSNPVHSVLLLIVCFFNGAGIALLLGAEFIAFLIMIVYVGAVAVLFLFVVMMLDLQSSPAQSLSLRLWGGTICGVLLTEMILMNMTKKQYVPGGFVVTAQDIGNVLYTKWFFPFELSGLILLITMVSTILLAEKKSKRSIKRQNVADQNRRSPESTLRLHNPKSHEGVLIPKDTL